MSLDKAQLVKMLSAAMGEEKADHAVVSAARAMAIGSDSFDREEALAVLDRIAQTPGLVGITARFAKTRVLFM